MDKFPCVANNAAILLDFLQWVVISQHNELDIWIHNVFMEFDPKDRRDPLSYFKVTEDHPQFSISVYSFNSISRQFGLALLFEAELYLLYVSKWQSIYFIDNNEASTRWNKHFPTSVEVADPGFLLSGSASRLTCCTSVLSHWPRLHLTRLDSHTHSVSSPGLLAAFHLQSASI